METLAAAMTMMVATDLARRNLAVDTDLQTLPEEMMMRRATGQPRNPSVVMVQVAIMTTTMVPLRSPAAAMDPLTTMTTAMVQPRSLAAAMVPLATMMSIMDRGPRHLAVVTDLRPPAVEMMMTTAMAPLRSRVVDMTVEMTTMTAMVPRRSLSADMAVETTTMTATALETNPVAAVMGPETLVPPNTRQVTHLATTIGMTRAVSRRN